MPDRREVLLGVASSLAVAIVPGAAISDPVSEVSGKCGAVAAGLIEWRVPTLTEARRASKIAALSCHWDKKRERLICHRTEVV